MKFFNIFFSVVFILFAVVQFNDPDPYLWVPIYLYPALLCYFKVMQKPLHKIAYWAGFLVFGIYAIYKMFDTNGIIDWLQFHNASNLASTMKAEKPWIEESREFFGLVIILLVLGFNYFKDNRTQSKINLN